MGVVTGEAMPTNSETLLSPRFAVQRSPEASTPMLTGVLSDPKPVVGESTVPLELSSAMLPAAAPLVIQMLLAPSVATPVGRFRPAERIGLTAQQPKVLTALMPVAATHVLPLASAAMPVGPWIALSVYWL